jgi:D-serine deaminase-like pyridoxal phosphate-dependent protein
VSEAEVVKELCEDLLIANEIVSPDKCSRVAALARDRAVTVAADSSNGIDALAAASRSAGVNIGILVDVNVGQGRCGVEPGAAAVALARRVASTAGLTLRGVMGYEGHLQPVRDRAEREARTRAAMQDLVETARQIRAAGMPCEIVSSGGTGTYDISGRVEGVTEIQAGSYALMDTDYGSVGVPFEQAFFVLGTIVSRPSPERCVADCGHKSMTKDHGCPSVKGVDGATVTGLNDEHRRSHSADPVAHGSHRQPPRCFLCHRRRPRRGCLAHFSSRLSRTSRHAVLAIAPREMSPRSEFHCRGRADGFCATCSRSK